MIQLTPHGIAAEDADLERLRAEFATRHYAMLPGFLAPSLLQYLLRHVEQARYETKQELHKGQEFGRTLFVPATEPAWFLTELFLNRPALFRMVERISGCRPIGNYVGRLHCTLPGPAHYIHWHDDINDDIENNRLVGLNISLSPAPFRGGNFQLREKGAERNLLSVGCLPAGDAFLFRLDRGIEHRLTPLESGAKRIVAVGWFRSEPTWDSFSRLLSFRGDAIPAGNH